MDPETKHHLEVAREHFRDGEYDLARPHLEAVRAHHDDFADVHNMLGCISYDEGNLRGAVAEFERSLEINPRYTEAALNLAVLYNELGRYDDARRVYSAAHGARDGEGLDKLDAFGRGKLANLHGELGDAYAAVGLLEHAMLEYRKGLRLCPTFVDIRTKLGTALRDLGKFSDALDEFIAIEELSPDYLPARIQLGITLWRVGRVEEARAQWQHVLEREPDNRSCQLYMRLAPPHAAPDPDPDPDDA